MAENTKNSSIETRSSAVILFVLTVCYRKKTAALLSIAGSSGTLDRLPSMFRLTRLRLFLLEHAAGLSISSRNIGNDNNTACPYCTAGPAVFARVRLETNQSADCPDEPDNVQSETNRSGLVRITEGQVKTARPCSFYICLCFCFCPCLRFYFVLLLFLLSVLPVFFFLFLLFLFFIILSFILFLLSFFSYLSYVPWRPFCPWWTKYADNTVFRLTISITGIFTIQTDHRQRTDILSLYLSV